MSEHKFPTEVIDLPSRGKVYGKESPLAEGKIEIKYMTTKEEDILMSENLIKKGVVIDTLLDSLIVTKGVKQEHLVLGDKNAILVACRILAYGPDYTCEVQHPKDPDKRVEHTFDLSQCPFKSIPQDIDYSNNSFDFETTHSYKEQAKFIKKMMDKKVLTIRAAENVVRILPPLNVKKSEINHAIKIINQVCKELKK
jgi:hypothetical protein